MNALKTLMKFAFCFLSLLIFSKAFAGPRLTSADCHLTKSGAAIKFSAADPSAVGGSLSDGFLADGANRYVVNVIYADLGQLTVQFFVYDQSNVAVQSHAFETPVSATGITRLKGSLSLTQGMGGDVSCDMQVDTRDSYANVKQVSAVAGASFRRVNYKGFGTAWQAPDGTIWSTYQGDFANVGADAPSGGFDRIVTDSDATRACAKIGGTLPTIDDYKKLMTQIDDEKTFATISNDMIGYYWSSSAQGDFARMMKGPDPFGDLKARATKLAVRCIGH